MMQAVRSKVLHVAMVLLLLFIPITYLVPSYALYKILGVTSVVTSSAVVYSYWPTLKYSVSQTIRELDRTDVLSMAIILIFASIAFREGYVMALQAFYPLGDSREAGYYLPPAFVRYSFIISALLALTSRNRSSLPGWPYAIISLGLGIVLGYCAILLI